MKENFFFYFKFFDSVFEIEKKIIGMMLKRFIEKLTPSSHHLTHTTSHPGYSQLNSEQSSQNLLGFADENINNENMIRNCKFIRRVSETAESFDDHQNHYNMSVENHNCDSSCLSENFLKVNYKIKCLKTYKFYLN